MKNTLVKFSLFICFLVLASCSKKSGTTASMSAVIDGTNFTAFGPAHVVTQPASGNDLVVAGTNLATTGSTPTTIAVTFANTLGTQTISSGQAFGIYTSSATLGMPLYASGGQVVVTSTSAHLVEGTFTLTFTNGSSVINVTSGRFTGTM